MKIFLSPHNDDEALFGAYTIMREKPLVIICTDSYIEQERGDDATREERINETKEAMKLLNAEVIFLHIPDKSFTKELLKDKLSKFSNVELAYAPAIENKGNYIHNAVGEVADELFETLHYTTYVTGNTKTKGNLFIFPIKKEKELKKKILKCYKSQMRIKSTAQYFKDKNVLEYESFL